MSAFQSSNPLWDFTLPPESLTSLPDDDFLAIIQSQIANPTITSDPTALFIPQTAPHQDIPLSANPRSLTRLHNGPHISPPSDSSPSPPSAAQEATSSRRDAVARRRSTGDDLLKRKAFRSEDDGEDDDDEPPSQRANPAERANNSKGSKRKSGSSAADEQRLLKRKEQNRAAQRAFRERKEKHVKDLEDQLAAVEAKNDQTQTENDNLKEMLRRLQTENTLLKQAAFTFSVPRAATKGSKDANKQTGETSSTAGQKKQATGSVSSSQTSPNSLFEDSFGEIAGFSAASSVTADSPKTFQPVEAAPQSADTSRPTPQDFMLGDSSPDWLSSQPLDFMSPVQSPFTLISSNPAYMSYRDPSPSNGFSPFGSMISPVPSGSVHSPFTPQSQQNFSSSAFSSDYNFNDFAMATPGELNAFNFETTSTNTINGSSLDDLFGSPFNPVSSFSPYSVGTSPISHPGSSTGLSPAAQSTANHNGRKCPSKEGLAQLVAAQGQSTFVATTDNGPITVQNGKLKFEGKQLPATEKSDSNVDAYVALQTLKEHPRYNECDINELCSEFANKAKCDGSRAVISQEGMQELMNHMNMPTRQA